MSAKVMLEIFIQVCIAIGTISVAILAIWGEWFRSKLASPKLQVNMMSRHGELTRFGDGRKVRYYHLKISNDRSWAPARNVRIMLTRVYKPAADGRFVPEPQATGLQLTWCYPEVSPMYRTMGPEEACDLGYVTQDGFKFSTYGIPHDFTGKLEHKGSLHAEVVAVADNGRSRPLHIMVAWDGTWNEGEAEMAKHLVIKESEQPP